MYNNKTNDEIRQIYTKNFRIDREEKPVVLASITERCPKQEVDWGRVQSDWSDEVTKCIDSIAEVNPYLDLSPGVEVLGVDAASWDPSVRGLDCRPKLFDANSQSWKLCDTGSMITVVRKGQDDKIDVNKKLQAVNGSSIACYGQKEIEIKIGRKPYRIKAVIADTSQDIIGWDYFKKHKLSLKWGDFGDLYI